MDNQCKTLVPHFLGWSLYMYWCEIEIVESYLTLKLKNDKLIVKKVVTRRVFKYFGDWPRFKDIGYLNSLTFESIWEYHQYTLSLGGFARFNTDARYHKNNTVYIQGSDVK